MTLTEPPQRLQQSSLLLGLTADIDWLSHVEVAVHDLRIFETLEHHLQGRAPDRYFSSMP